MLGVVGDSLEDPAQSGKGLLARAVVRGVGWRSVGPGLQRSLQGFFYFSPEVSLGRFPQHQ